MNVMSLPAPSRWRRRSSDCRRDLLCILGGRTLVEKRCGDIGDARLGCRILRPAGPHEESQADRRLLVMRDGDDL